MAKLPKGLVLACSLALVALAACGQSDEKKDKQAAATKTAPTAATSAPSDAIDPCSLLTKDEARAVLGAAVGEARKRKIVGFAPGQSCAYYTSAPIEQAGGVWSVKVAVYDPATFKAEDSYFASPKVFFERTRKAQMAVKSEYPPRDVTGLGEAAFWQPAPAVLNILDRGVYLTVSVHADFHIPPTTTEKLHAAEEAAQLKAARYLAQKTLLPRLETR